MLSLPHIGFWPAGITSLGLQASAVKLAWSQPGFAGGEDKA
jgi:hypothetical protein